MTTLEQQNVNSTYEMIAIKQACKKPRTRGKDRGAEILPHMEHFVQLTRNLKRVTLLYSLFEGIHGAPLVAPLELSGDRPGVLPIRLRDAVFTAVAGINKDEQESIERVAERVMLLCSDEHGALAVNSLLDCNDLHDAMAMVSPTDRFSRALHLYLRQYFASEGGAKENRFDHAEMQHEMLRCSQSEKYSSHYVGPKGAEPFLSQDGEQVLRQRIGQLFPKISPDDMLVECFKHRDQYTLNIMFNGKEVHLRQIRNGAPVAINLATIIDVRYKWHISKAELTVFCEDLEIRPELAKLFRDIVLAGSGDIRSMPLREFNLMGFCTPAMLGRLQRDRIEGIEKIEIGHLVVCKPELRQVMQRGRMQQRRMNSPLTIRRDRFEDRDIYAVAHQLYKLEDLTDCVIQQVRLTMRIAKTIHRPAHNVTFQTGVPNQFSHARLTKDDSELVFVQLIRLGCARQY